MDQPQESAVTAEPVLDVANSNNNETSSSVPAISEKRDGLFNGVYFCLCDDVKDIDEVS